MRQSCVLYRVIGAIACLVLTCVTGCSPKPSTSPIPNSDSGTVVNTAKPKVTLGIQMSPAMALVMVAKDKGCFDQAGVDVELKGFTAGKFALQAFMGGSLDFAVAGEVPTTLATLQGNKLIVLSQVVERTHTEVRVVARRDGNINDPKTYFSSKRRKLATSFGGGPEFYTYNFLKKNGLTGKVTVLSQQPADMPAALVSGSVDAIAIFDPFAYIAEQRLGKDGITFADADLYSELYVLIAKPGDPTQKKQVVDALLKGLVKAKEAIQQDPEGAKQIVLKYTKQDRAVIDGIWKNFVFAPALNRLLLDDMLAETAWAREKGTISKTAATPDFRKEVIDTTALKAIDPSAVTLP